MDGKAKPKTRLINERYLSKEGRRDIYEARLPSRNESRGRGAGVREGLPNSESEGDGDLLGRGLEIQQSEQQTINQNANQPTARVERIIPDIDEQLCK